MYGIPCGILWGLDEWTSAVLTSGRLACLQLSVFVVKITMCIFSVTPFALLVYLMQMWMRSSERLVPLVSRFEGQTEKDV